VQFRLGYLRQLDPEDLDSQVADPLLGQLAYHLKIVAGVLLRDLRFSEIGCHHLYVARVH